MLAYVHYKKYSLAVVAYKLSFMNTNRTFKYLFIVVCLSVGLAGFLIKPTGFKKEEHVTANLLAIQAMLDQFKNDNGQYPTTQQGLLQLYESNYVNTKNVAIDAWESKLIYTLNGDSFTLYSIGENLIDEAGSGDDITLPAE